MIDAISEILVKTLLTGPPHGTLTVLNFALSFFDFSDVSGRWLCLLTLQVSSDPDLSKEARRGLDPHQLRILFPQHRDAASYPKLADLLSWPSKWVFCKTYSPISCLHDFQPAVLNALVNISTISFYAMHLPALVDPKIERYQEVLRELVKHDFNAKRILQRRVTTDLTYNHEGDLAVFVPTLISIILERQSEVAVNTLIDILALSFSSVEQFVLTHVVDFLNIALKSPVEPFRSRISLLYAIVASSPQQTIQEIEMQITRVPTMTSQDRSLSDPTVVIPLLRCMSIRGRSFSLDLSLWEEKFLERCSAKEENYISASVTKLLDLAYTDSVQYRAKHISALLAIWKQHKTRASTEILKRILPTLATLTIPLLSDSDQLQEVLENFMVNTDSSIELSLALGEALSVTLGRWHSRSFLVRLEIPLGSKVHDFDIRVDLLTSSIERLLAGLTSSSLCERRGSFFKLLCLVQLLDCSEIDSRLTNIHNAFLMVLGDKDELLAEAAIKGLQIVYHRAETGQRDEMIIQAFRTFLRKAGPERIIPNQESAATLLDLEPNVEQSTARTIDNNSSTRLYRDLYNLCLEIGHKTLLYYLLDMVPNEPIFSIHHEALLGFHSLSLEQDHSRELLQSSQVLLALLPKVFRYRHDPSAKIASRFQSIFVRLFPEDKHTIDQNFELIMNELLCCMSDSAWRTRESAIRALTTLIIGRPTSELQTQIERLWSAGFRALDDIKESVRESSLAFCKGLASALLKSSTDENASTASSIFELGIPLLMTEIHSQSKEVSAFALKTLLNITKEAKTSAIGRFLPALIEEFLLLTSNMEPETLNYLSFHVSKYDLSQNDLDQHRLSAIRNSPILDALEQCIDHLDVSSAVLAMPKVYHIIGQTHGLPTRAATSRFMISLTSRNPELMRLHADAAIGALTKTLDDRSETVVSLSASAVGYLVRVASQDRIVALVTLLAKKLSEGSQSLSAGLVVRAISQNANDKFQDFGSLFLPLCFLAMHDQVESDRVHFRAVWDNNTGSTGAMKLYQKEIITLAEQYLTSPAWRMRQMAASALAELAKSVVLRPETQQELFRLLTAGLDSRAWDGKEDVLGAFVALMRMDSSSVTDAQRIIARKIMAREASRTNLKYRLKALSHFASFLERDEKCSSFQVVHDLIEQDLDELDNEIEKNAMTLELLRCLGHAYRPVHDNDRAQQYRALLTYCFTTSEISWTFKQHVCEVLKTSFERIANSKSFWTAEDMPRTWSLLSTCLQERAHRIVRETAISTCQAFRHACVQQGIGADQMSSFKGQIENMIQMETDPVMQALLDTLSSSYM